MHFIYIFKSIRIPVIPRFRILIKTLLTELLYYAFSLLCIKKVKCTLIQTLRLCTGRTAHRGCRGIALLFLDHGTRRGWGVSVTPPPLFTPRKDPVPIVREAGWAPGPVWTGAENLAPTGIRSSDRPVRSQSLCRLRCPAHFYCVLLPCIILKILLVVTSEFLFETSFPPPLSLCYL